MPQRMYHSPGGPFWPPGDFLFESTSGSIPRSSHISLRALIIGDQAVDWQYRTACKRTR